ncbi:MAG: hypothetical protein HQM13_14530 [SAR324 cluster bacterium]|nr:hypothetical protein [SAR324 cluster bacterium]
MTKNEENFQKFYNENYRKWDGCLSSFAKEIGIHLENIGLKFSIKSRIKNIESLNLKQIHYEGQKETCDEKIKDLLGLRTVVPFQEDIEHIITAIVNNFNVIEIERKSDNLSYREFAYDSVHLIIAIEDEGILFPDHCLKGCELQIRTILQDAWAEVEHELIYKSKFRFYNESIRKKLAALNANLTLSDMIFQEIRDTQKEQERWGQERFQELKKKATSVKIKNIPDFIEGSQTVEQNENSKNSYIIDKNLETVFVKALETHHIKDYKNAVDLYSQVLELNPDLKICSIVYNHRGMANFMLQLEHQALRDFEMSFRCDSTNYRALNNRALVLRRMGYLSEAFEDFKRSLELKEDQSEVYYLRAQTNFETNNFARAIEDLQIALQLEPTYKDALSLMKEVSMKIGKRSEVSSEN